MSVEQTHSAPVTKKVLPWAALTLLFLGSSFIAAHYWQQNLKVESVLVEGNYFTTTDEIVEVAAIELGTKPDSINLSLVSEAVTKLDYIHSVIPYIDAIGRVKLTIRERLPIALLVKGSSELYVDAYGVKLPVIAGKNQNVPLVYGFNAQSTRDTLNTESFKQVRDFLVQAMNNPFTWATISEVVYTPYEGVVALSHENGVKLLFGHHQFAEKIENWEIFYTEVIRSKGIQSMQQIDLRFIDQVVTREVDS